MCIVIPQDLEEWSMVIGSGEGRQGEFMGRAGKGQ